MGISGCWKMARVDALSGWNHKRLKPSVFLAVWRWLVLRENDQSKDPTRSLTPELGQCDLLALPKFELVTAQ